MIPKFTGSMISLECWAGDEFLSLYILIVAHDGNANI